MCGAGQGKLKRQLADCTWERNIGRSLGRGLCGEPLLWGCALQLQAISRQGLAPNLESRASLYLTSLSPLVCQAPHPILPTCSALLTGCTWSHAVLGDTL